MEINRYIHLYKPGDEFQFFLSGDLHLDEPDFMTYAAIKELEAAKKRNARIYLPGDVFSGIFPTDKKRWSPSSQPPTEDGGRPRDAVMNDMISRGVELLAPYANYIDQIHMGNHEVSVLKYHHTDMISLLIHDLNKIRDTGKHGFIRHGGYRGWILMNFREQGKRSTGRGKWFSLFYYHGTGGSAPVTRGTISLARLRADRGSADCIWVAHHHQFMHTKYRNEGATSNGVWYNKETHGVVTACYKEFRKKYDIEKTGYRIDFVEEKQLSMYGVGGGFMKIRPQRDYIECRVSS